MTQRPVHFPAARRRLFPAWRRAGQRVGVPRHRGPDPPGATVLPPGCTSGCVTATADGSYPGVWNNALADGSFGITSPIFLNEITPEGRPGTPAH
jgi:hypothetical protein